MTTVETMKGPVDTGALGRVLMHELARLEMPSWHFLHISKEVIPALVTRGVTVEQIDQMLADNPRRIFEQSRGAY